MNKPQKFINGKNGLAKLIKNLKEKLKDNLLNNPFSPFLRFPFLSLFNFGEK
jgi:hypothetical protein